MTLNLARVAASRKPFTIDGGKRLNNGIPPWFATNRVDNRQAMFPLPRK